MIYGKKEIIKVHNCCLGYTVYNNQLLFAPYRIINRLGKNNIKLQPRNDITKMKGKYIIEALKKHFNINISEDIYLFNKPCKISINKNN